MHIKDPVAHVRVPGLWKYQDNPAFTKSVILKNVEVGHYSLYCVKKKKDVFGANGTRQSVCYVIP